MSSVTWNLLPKSQDDPETIEQAIARIVDEHNENEEAHLDTGQSLQSHKASEIIDHVAESIIEDKIKDGEITGVKITNNQILGKDFRTAENVGEGVDGVKFNSSGIEMWQNGEKKVDIPVSGDPTFKGKATVKSLSFSRFTRLIPFESKDAYTEITGGDGYFEVLVNAVRCFWTTTINNIVKLILSNWGVPFLKLSTNPTLEFSLSHGDPNHAVFAVVLGSRYPIEDNAAGFQFGFRFKGNGSNECKIYSFLSNYGTETTQETDLGVLSASVQKRYRAEMDFSIKTIYYYINDVLVDTLVFSSGDDNFDETFSICQKTLSGISGLLYVWNMVIQYDE